MSERLTKAKLLEAMDVLEREDDRGVGYERDYGACQGCGSEDNHSENCVIAKREAIVSAWRRKKGEAQDAS